MKSKFIKIYILLPLAIILCIGNVYSCSQSGKTNPHPNPTNPNQDDATKVPMDPASNKLTPDQAQLLYRKFYLRTLAKLPPISDKKFEASVDYSDLKTSLRETYTENDALKALSHTLVRSYPLSFDKFGSNLWDRLRMIEEQILQIDTVLLNLLKSLLEENQNYENQEKVMELLCLNKTDLNKHQFRSFLTQEKVASISDITKNWDKNNSCKGCHQFSDSQTFNLRKIFPSTDINQETYLSTALNECLLKKLFSSDLNTSFQQLRDPLTPTAVLRTYNFRLLSSLTPKLYSIQTDQKLNWPRKFFEIQLLKISSDLVIYQSGSMFDLLDWKSVLDHPLFNHTMLEPILSKKSTLDFNQMSLTYVAEQLEMANLASSHLQTSVLKKEFSECKDSANSTCLIQLYFYLSGKSYDENNVLFSNLATEMTNQTNNLNSTMYLFFSSPHFLEL